MATQKSRGVVKHAADVIVDLDSLQGAVAALRAELAAAIMAAKAADRAIEVDLLKTAPDTWDAILVKARTEAVDAARAAIEDAIRRAGNVLALNHTLLAG